MTKYFCSRKWAIDTFVERVKELTDSRKKFDQECQFCWVKDVKMLTCNECPLNGPWENSFWYKGFLCLELRDKLVDGVFRPDLVIRSFKRWAKKQHDEDWEREE